MYLYHLLSFITNQTHLPQRTQNHPTCPLRHVLMCLRTPEFLGQPEVYNVDHIIVVPNEIIRLDISMYIMTGMHEFDLGGGNTKEFRKD